MSDELIKSLERQLAESRRGEAEAKAEAKKRRIAAKGTAGEVEDLRAKLQAAEAERDRLKANPDAMAAENEKLRGEIREGKHRARFEALAREAKVNPSAEALDDLWHRSGYKPEGDAPSDDSIRKAIGEAVKVRPWLLQADGQAPEAPAPTGGTTAPQLPATPPGPGALRGDPAPNAGQMVVTRAQLSNPEWALNPANQKAMNDARASQTLTIKD